jgi:DNA-binding LacI/PurR family transcriptional regulator
MVALNDYMAMGAMAALQKHGLLPGEEVAVTGFDDNPIVQYLRPSLTTVRQPIWEIGKKVMKCWYINWMKEVTGSHLLFDSSETDHSPIKPAASEEREEA